MRLEERARLRGLYAITPGWPETERLLAAVRGSIEGGASAIQYRAKNLSGQLRGAQARRLAALCRSCSVPLIVNDSVELALACGADGVHLGRDDGDVRAARRALPRGLIGVSCYDDVERARDAGRDGADYVAIGSVFASATKPAAVHTPLERIAGARAAAGLPVVAIGGIDARNAQLARDAGADMVAVISFLFEARDVRAAAWSISRLFEPHDRGAHDVRAQQGPL